VNAARPTDARDDLPLARAVPHRRWSIQLIWVIPILAALIGGWLAVRAVLERGPVVTITFSTAEGIEINKTRIKYRSVEIGRVTGVGFTEDRARVVVTAELTKQAEPLLVDGSKFWVVRPRISINQISGLGTLLSGAYIGLETGTSDQSRRRFDGLDQPPVVSVDLPGRQFALRATDLGSIDVGAPVLYRRVQVGQVIAYELDEDGTGVTVQVFINAPYDRYVTADTRFWQASGFDVALDAGGVSVNTESLASILVGGIAFQAPASDAKEAAAPAGSVFSLFSDRAKALRLPDTEEAFYTLFFPDSVRGLSVGAPVDFRGVVVGEVTEIDIRFDDSKHEVKIPVQVKLFPDRLRGRRGKEGAGKTVPTETVMDRLVARGMRAQLRSGSLITGQLYVALDFFPDSPAAKVVRSGDITQLPTMPGSLQALQETLLAVATKLNNLPLEAIGQDVRTALSSLDQLLASADAAVKKIDGELTPKAASAIESVSQTLAGVDKTLANADRLLSEDGAVQRDLRDALREVSRASEAMRSLADYIERNPSALIRGRSDEDAQDE
jgi:paraquat-inducible protein B